MSLRRLLNFAYATLIDGMMGFGITRAEARASIDAKLLEASETEEQRVEREERESAQRNAQAFRGLLGDLGGLGAKAG